MTATSRAMLTGVAQKLVAARDPGSGRADRLRRRLAGHEDRGISLAELAALPDWITARESQVAIARRAALLSMAPALAASIDGGWLGALAAVAGEGAVDDAIAMADRIGDAGLPPLPADELERHGFALLRATLPPHVARLLDESNDDPETLEPDLAHRCVALAAGQPS